MIKETKAPNYYIAEKAEINAEIEFSGQIVRLEVLNKSCYTNVSVTKRGYNQIVPGQEVRYTFTNIKNNSNRTAEQLLLERYPSCQCGEIGENHHRHLESETFL